MKQKILSLLVLLLTAATGTWADDTYTVKFEANGNSKTIENVTLPKTWACNWNSENGELDLIIKELYQLSSGYSSTSPNTSVTGGNGKVTVVSSKDQSITISEPFEGTATVEGMYKNNNIGEYFSYSLTISIPGYVAPAGTETIDVNPVAGQQNQWEFDMPASNVVLTPIYSAATIYDADGQTEKQAYETLKEAFAAVQTGDIIKLDWNVTLTEDLETPTIDGGVKFTLDFNGYTIDGGTTYNVDLQNAGDELTFTDSSNDQLGGLIAEGLDLVDGGGFVFDGGRYNFLGANAEDFNSLCSDPSGALSLAEGKEFVDLEGGAEANDGFTVRVDYKTFELAIPAGKFATFCDNHNVALATGTDASVGLYTISSIDDERTTATATAISSAVVPGTMPMLVYNGSDADQTVKLKVSPDAVTGAQTWAGAFLGSAIEHEFTATDMQANDYYALSGGQLFVPVLSAGTIAAHKCWLQFPKQQTPGSRSLTIVFEGNGTTGIADNKRESTTNNRYYDLNGRQLNAAPTQKGVYILNGKKVVVK